MDYLTLVSHSEDAPLTSGKAAPADGASDLKQLAKIPGTGSQPLTRAPAFSG